MKRDLETKVLKLVNQLMAQGTAEFFEGTLFLEDTSTETFKTILTELSMLGNYGKVKGSVISPESYFAIDFA